MPHVLLAVLLSAPIQIAAPGVSAVGVEKSQADFYLGYLAQQLEAQSGAQVLTPDALASLVGLERQRQLLGCPEGSVTCLAELAAGLGTELVLVTSIAKVEGGGWVLTTKLLSAQTAKTVASVTEHAATQPAFLEALARAAKTLASGLGNRTAGEVARTSGGKVLPWLGWAGIGAGVVAAGVGATLFALSKGDAQALKTGTGLAPTAAQAARDRGAAFQGAGVALLGVGAALAVGGVSWLVFGPDEGPPPVGLAVSGDGAGLVLGGRF